jgi:hypothetical protein
MPDAISTSASTPASPASAPAPVDSAAPAASSGAVGSGAQGADSSAAPANTDAAPKATGEVKPLPDKAIEPLPKYPTPEEVDWDKWDGKPDTLPEPVRPWYDRFNGRYTKERGDLEKQLGHYKTLYDALSFNEEDPRIGELTGKVSTYEQKVAEYEARISQYEAAEEERLNTESRSEVDKFWSENPDFKTDEALRGKLASLVEGGWFYKNAARVAKMPEDLQAWADEQRKAGVPEEKVVEYAEERVKMRKPAAPPRRPGTDLVTGSGPVAKTEIAEKEASPVEDFETWRNNKVKKHLANARG